MTKEEEKFNDYDSEPVKYCSKCYSLKIKHDDIIDDDYCDDCGCTDILECGIDEWEKLYEERYGKSFTKKNNNTKSSNTEKKSPQELKLMLCNCQSWEAIIFSLYPKFPKGLGKADAIMLLFDKVLKDNRFDELKTLIIKKCKH